MLFVFPPREELRRLAGRGEPPGIVVVRSGALGDTVLLLSTLRLIEAWFPQGRLTLIGSHWAAQLCPLLPRPWEFVPFESPDFAPLFVPECCGDAPAPLREADCAIVYTAEPEGVFAQNVRRLCRGSVITWPVEPPPGVHAACHLAAALAGAVPAEDELPRPMLRPGAEARRNAQRWLQEQAGPDGALVVVHPGSGGEWKRWPASLFARLIRRLGKRGARAVLLKGPADDRACESVLSSLAGCSRPVVAAFESLESVAALIARADAFIGSDSGLTHLAAAVGVPTVALFGPTDPAVWKPLGKAVTVLRGKATRQNPSAWPNLRDVLNAVLPPTAGRAC